MAKVATMEDDFDVVKAEEVHTKSADQPPPQQRQGPAANGAQIMNWDNRDVSTWLASIGYKDLIPIFQHSNVNGMVLSKLGDRLLKEMGVNNVGTRVQLMVEVLKIQAAGRAQWRNEALWSDVEYRPGPCNDTLPLGFPTCCCCADLCYGKAHLYTLTNSRLHVVSSHRIVYPLLPCSVCCCLFHTNVKNLDMSMVQEIDAEFSNSCCGDPQGRVRLTANDGSKVKLNLRSSECQTVSKIMNDAKEEAGIMANFLAMSMAR